MQRGFPRVKIHGNAAILKHVPANQNVMRRVKGGKRGYIYLNIHDWQLKNHVENMDFDARHSRLTDTLGVDRGEAQPASQAGANTGGVGSSVYLSQDPNSLHMSNACNANLHGGTMLKQLINGLSEADWGPSGFFIICHRGFSNAGTP
jgi:hypothetical protein